MYALPEAGGSNLQKFGINALLAKENATEGLRFLLQVRGRPSVSNFTASFTEDPYKQVKGANKLPSTKRKEITGQKNVRREME